jgi:hypothetical protein
MEAVSTSGMSVNFYETTRHIIPEDSHLHILRRENLKSRKILNGFVPLFAEHSKSCSDVQCFEYCLCNV